jgi:hypothetical protein
MEKQTPVGIYNKEVFIAHEFDGKITHFDVIRLVDEDSLEDYRNPDYRREEYKDMWKQAVAADATEQSFDDWFDDAWNESYDEDDPEDFPCKDDSDVCVLTEEEREEADRFIEENYGIIVGTWEASGCYDPEFRDGKFAGWDYIFERGCKIAEDYVKKHRK